MTLANFMRNVAFAVSLGSIYALVVIGYTIVWGVLGLINIAHGDFFMLAAFVAMWSSFRYQMSWPVSLLLGLVVAPLVGVVVERVAYRPLRAHKISAFTSAVAVSFFLESVVVVFFTARPKPFPQPTFVRGVLNLGGISIPAVTVLTVVVAILLFLALTYVVTRTSMGRAMRALSRDDRF